MLGVLSSPVSKSLSCLVAAGRPRGFLPYLADLSFGYLAEGLTQRCTSALSTNPHTTHVIAALVPSL